VASSCGRKGTLSHQNDCEAVVGPSPCANAGDRSSSKKFPRIALSEPYPLLDPGNYVAVCTEATFAWSKQWGKWIVRLVLEPENYKGRPYTGRLCKFLGLGKNKERPYAGPQSHFRVLYVEVNGDQPPSLEVGVEIFVGVCFVIEVATVKQDRNGKPRSPEHWYSIVRDIHLCKSSSVSLQPSNLVRFNPSTQRTQSTFTTDQHSNTMNTPPAEKKGKC
jgi:hypothetical protein